MNLISINKSKAENKMMETQVRKLIRDSGLPLGTFAEALGWSNSRTLSWWSGQKPQSMNFSDLKALAQYLGVPIETIFEGSYNLSLIRQRVIQGPSALPEHYSKNASSYVRTCVHIIEYLSMLYGRHFVDHVLRALAIHPLFFEDPKNKINISFYVDIFNKLSERGISDNEISSLACYIFLNLRDTELGHSFKTAQSYHDFYVRLEQNATLFESNFKYELQLAPQKVRILAHPSEVTLSLVQQNPQSFRKLFLYRKTVLGWFPTLAHLSPLTMSTTKCVLQGDPYTVYEADIPPSLERSDRNSFLVLRHL